MADLDACYFCGTIGTSLERRAVVPEEALPDPDTQRTVVLCPTCHEKLETVVAPLVERVADSANGTEASERSDSRSEFREGITFGESPEGRQTGAARPTDRERVSTGDDPSKADETLQPPVSPTEADDADEPAAEVGDPDDSPTGTGEPDESAERGDPDDSPTETDDAAERGVDRVTGGGGSSREDVPDGSTGPSGESGTAAGPESNDASSGVEAESDRTGPSLDIAGGSTTGGRVRDYRKVLRLFNNRELPIARAEAQMLAASAYDLEEAEVGEFIDVALEVGHLVETDDGLDFPD